jgi:hypothetical protein
MKLDPSTFPQALLPVLVGMWLRRLALWKWIDWMNLTLTHFVEPGRMQYEPMTPILSGRVSCVRGLFSGALQRSLRACVVLVRCVRPLPGLSFFWQRHARNWLRIRPQKNWYIANRTSLLATTDNWHTDTQSMAAYTPQPSFDPSVLYHSISTVQ